MLIVRVVDLWNLKLKDSKMQFLFTNIVICACVYTCNLFEFKCPYTSEWRFRAFVRCNGTSITQYQCLFDELGQYRQTRYTFIESCHNMPDYVQPGYKYVVSGGRRKKECSLDKYQPFLFWSNITHECFFSKSKCSDMGQIVYNNGTTETDSQCRCDYKKGYDFINKPVNKCFCVPSREDCSCYKKTCSGTQILSPDYKCKELKDVLSQSMCPPLLYSGIIKETGSLNILQKKTLSSQHLWKNKRSTELVLLTHVTIIIIMIALFGSSFLIVTESCPWIFFITLNPAFNITAKLNEDCSIKLVWTWPKTKYERSKYIIEYTYDDWKTTIAFERKEKKSFCIMTNIVPYKTYRIRVIYFCISDGNLIESLASNEILIETESPKLNVHAEKDIKDKCLKISWSKPDNINILIQQYTVLYSYDNWETHKRLIVPATMLYGKIKGIVPLKTYKFKGLYKCSCSPTELTIETCISEPGNEVSLYTDGPGRPENPMTEGLEKSMTLRWSPPVETLFKTKEYKIQYTTDDNWDKATCKIIPADNSLQFSMKELSESTVYLFRIYNCINDNIESLPSTAIFSNKFACRISLPIDNVQYNANFDNPDSDEYRSATEDLIPAVDKVYKQMNGLQKSYLNNYSNGSLIASLVLTSQDFYDEMALQNVIEEYVNKGALGRFTIKHDGFVFHALNKPLPPEIDKLSVQKGCITITWSLQRESFFKIEYYIIELTTDDWQAPQTFFCLGTEFNHRVQNLSTTTTFRFRVVTCTHNLIKSRPSSEIKTTVIVPLPVIKMKVTLFCKSSECFLITWDQSECSTSSANIIDYYKIMINGKHVNSTSEKSYKYIPQISGYTMYKFAVIACATNGLEGEIGEEVTCNSKKEPLPPRNVITTSTSRGIKMSWEKPTYPNRVKTFTIKIMNEEETFVTVQGSEKSCMLNKLQPLTKYLLSMSTCSFENFEGRPSATLECVTKDPLPPTQLNMVECHNGFKLTWLETKFPVGRHFKNYIVYTKFENEETIKTTTLSSCLFRRLNSSCIYEFSCSTVSSNDITSTRSESLTYVPPSVLPRRETS